MHIQSNILTFYKDIGNTLLNQFPEGTTKIMIEYDQSFVGSEWKIRCYDARGNRLDSLRLLNEKETKCKNGCNGSTTGCSDCPN